MNITRVSLKSAGQRCTRYTVIQRDPVLSSDRRFKRFQEPATYIVDAAKCCVESTLSATNESNMGVKIGTCNFTLKGVINFQRNDENRRHFVCMIVLLLLDCQV